MAETGSGWSETERTFLVALSHDIQLGWIRLSSLYRLFGSWEAVWKASKAQLERSGVSAKSAERITSFTRRNDPEALLSRLDQLGISFVCMKEEDYPTLLGETGSPPPALFYRGSLAALRLDTLAVVGTRKASPYGEAAVEFLIPPLVKSGVTIVSGLALGIDSLAHQETIRTGGVTIAVLGHGLDSIFPPSNARLAEQILMKGALVSEYPPGVPALKHHFPVRNRVISGLSRGALIVEAGERSGSLITAKYALSESREVFAVPGEIFLASSIGTNRLIQQGAKAVLSPADVLDELDYNAAGSRRLPLPDSPREATILSVLEGGPTHIETLISACKMPAAVLQQTLTLMEIGDKVRHQGGGFYRIRR